MKSNLKWASTLLATAFVLASGTAPAFAVSACLSARFHDYKDFGCHSTPGSAGSPSAAMSNAGGNQAQCINCGGSDSGMPSWWVDEPYINLWVSDVPLSYTTSSGQKISFRWTYHQRGQVDQPWRTRELETIFPNYYDIGPRVPMRYTFNDVSGGFVMTNAAWQHNYWSQIIFWDSNLENNSIAAPAVIAQYTSGTNNQTNAYVGYTYGYEGLIFRGDGGTIDFNIDNSGVLTASGNVQVQVINPDTNSGPRIPWTWLDSSGHTRYLYPQTNAFFVTNPYTGFKVTYPDGSQDIYGLVYYQANVTAWNFNNSPRCQSTAIACMTERIDPQGHATLIGYEPNGTNTLEYRVKYVVDSDGRTNTYNYNSNNWQQIANITDPFGRMAQFTPDSDCGLASITDAQSNTTYFSYASSNGWMSQMETPYGTTSFYYYQLQESGATNEYEQRAAYVSEPLGAQQLFYYIHQGTPGVPSSRTPPVVPGQTFDSGTNGTGSSLHYALTYRDTFHWGRRQFANLSGSVKSGFNELNFNPSFFDFGGTLGNLTSEDFAKARLRHWMLDPDQISITETLSCERQPSTDSAGLNPGTWLFYGNGNYAPEPEIDQGAQVTAVAQILPDGTSQYTRYHYFGSDPIVSDNESSRTLPNGTLGEVTNWFTYAAGNIDLLSVSNSIGQYVNNGFNANHEVTSSTNALNYSNTFTWNSSTHNLTSITLASGKKLTFSYYPQIGQTNANLARLLDTISIQPENCTIEITDYTNNLPRTIHVSGTNIQDLWFTNFWDGLNRLTGRAFQDNSTISNIYTVLDLTASKDRMGNWTYYGYDALQHITAVTNANQGVTTLSWCDCGALSSVSDPLRNTNFYHYDNQGNLTNIAFADGSSRSYQYDLNGRVTNDFDGSLRAFQLYYNNQGLVSSVSNSYGNLRQVVYDLVDRPIEITDANNITISNRYDSINRLLSRVWLTDGLGESFVYATNGLIAYTNRDNQPTLFGRDAAGRLTSTTNDNQEITTFTYDGADRLIALVDGLLHTNTWNYNQYGWVTNKVDASNNVAFAYSYNANGWLTNRWMPASGNTQYKFDAVGNVTNIIYSNSATASISYLYDADNRLTNMVDAVGTTVFGYTKIGQLASESYPFSSSTGTIDYLYSQGHRTNFSLSQPSGPWNQAYSYDSEWRMTGITSPAGSFAYGYPTSASALIQSLGLPNAAGISYQYDSLARLTNSSLANYWGQVLDGYGYAYDPLGQRTNISRYLGITTNNISAAYDNIGQLISWTAKETSGTARLNEQLGYGYDAGHNLQFRTNEALAQTFTVDALNQLSTVTHTGTLTVSGAAPAPMSNIVVNGTAAQSYGDFTFARTNFTLFNGTNSFTNVAQNVYGVTTTNAFSVNLPSNVSFQYDGNGNLTNDGTRSFVYDAENQLTNVNLPNSWKTEYVYDGLRRKRVTRDYIWNGAWVKTNETRYIYDGMLVIQERDTNNVPLVSYARGLDLSGSRQGAGGIGGLLARSDASGSTFYHSDGSGNITALIDQNQNIVARYEYDGFGRLIGKWGALADANVYRFSSKEFQRSSGLYAYGYRFYEPNSQRWLNRDPIGVRGGVNLYSFTRNGPTRGIDLWGLQEEADPVTEANFYRLFETPEEKARDDAADQGEPENTFIGPPTSPMPPPIPPDQLTPEEIQNIIGTVPQPYLGTPADPAAEQAREDFENLKKTERDIGKECLRKAPPPNGGESGKHGGSAHDKTINDFINSLPEGAEDIRKNQWQVDFDGNIVGNNRPDVQYNLDGYHYNVEFDNDPASGFMHSDVIEGNDPSSVVSSYFLNPF